MKDRKIQALLGKFEVDNATPTQFKIFLSALNILLKILEISTLEELTGLNMPDTQIIQMLISRMSDDDIGFLTEKLTLGTLSIKDCQIAVQREFEFTKRKQLAAYFTDDKGLDIMGEIVQYSIDRNEKGQKLVIGDPFMGTARTLVHVIKIVGENKIRSIFGIEPYFLSALVGYVAIAAEMSENIENIHVFVGDAFSEGPRLLSPLHQHPLPKLDIIITNPPFTRWKYLPISARQTLQDFTKSCGYQHLVSRKSMSLQIYGLLLCDFLLKPRGYLLSVVPLSTFYTIGGNSFKTLLRAKYSVLGMIESNSEASFSIDSGFKEIITICKKEASSPLKNSLISKNESKKLTLFTEFRSNKAEIAQALFHNKTLIGGNYYDVEKLPPYLDSNWLVLFINHPLQQMMESLLETEIEKGTIVFWRDIVAEEKLIRGFEMYGPDFFFLPNKFWEIDSHDEKSVVIKHQDGSKLEIECVFLKKALSKPSKYYNGIIPEENVFVFDIPPENLQNFPIGLQDYLQWGIKSKTPQPAMNAFGRYWYSHVHECLNTKIPKGYLFIGDKFDLNLKNRAAIANFSPQKIFVSKNFYTVKDIDMKTSKILAAWLNSSLFLAILILFSRKISNSWTRFLRDDYLKLPIINIAELTAESEDLILKSFEDFIHFEVLPPVWDQINTPLRKALDLAILKSFNIEQPGHKLAQLYNFLCSYRENYLVSENQGT